MQKALLVVVFITGLQTALIAADKGRDVFETESRTGKLSPAATTVFLLPALNSYGLSTGK